MKQAETSHYGHVAFVILAFLLGGIAGYYVGAAYEYDNQAEAQAYSITPGFHKRVKTVATPTPTPTTTTTPAAQ